jgi:hypothetical protein
MRLLFSAAYAWPTASQTSLLLHKPITHTCTRSVLLHCPQPTTPITTRRAMDLLVAKVRLHVFIDCQANHGDAGHPVCIPSSTSSSHCSFNLTRACAGVHAPPLHAKSMLRSSQLLYSTTCCSKACHSTTALTLLSTAPTYNLQDDRRPHTLLNCKQFDSSIYNQD